MIKCIYIYMDVSKNRGILPPKWMVYNGKPYFLMDDLGVPLFLETPIYIYIQLYVFIYTRSAAIALTKWT